MLAAAGFGFAADNTLLPGTVKTLVVAGAALCSLVSVWMSYRLESGPYLFLATGVAIIGLAPGAVDGELRFLLADSSRYLFLLAAIGASWSLVNGGMISRRLLGCLVLTTIWISVATVWALAARRSWYPEWVTNNSDTSFGLNSVYVLLALLVWSITWTGRAGVVEFLSTILAIAILATGTRALIAASVLVIVSRLATPNQRRNLLRAAILPSVAVLLLNYSGQAAQIQRSVERTIGTDIGGDASARARNVQWGEAWNLALAWPAESLSASEIEVPVFSPGVGGTRFASVLDTPLTTLAKLGIAAGIILWVLVGLLVWSIIRRSPNGRKYLVSAIPLLATAAVLENRGFGVAILLLAALSSRGTGTKPSPRRAEFATANERRTAVAQASEC